MGHLLQSTGVAVLDPTTDGLISVLLILFVLIMVAIAFIMTLRNAWKIFALYKRKKAAKETPNILVSREIMAVVAGGEQEQDSSGDTSARSWHGTM